MADPPRIEDLDQPGLAGGPGPTPPGLDDGTPKPAGGAPGVPPPVPGGGEPGRSGGPEPGEERPRVARSDPEEPDPS